MIRARHLSRLIRTQPHFPLRLRMAYHFHGRVQYRILLTAASPKLLHIQCANVICSVKSVTNLLRRHPCRENSVGDFRGQSVVKGLAQCI